MMNSKNVTMLNDEEMTTVSGGYRQTKLPDTTRITMGNSSRRIPDSTESTESAVCSARR